MGKSHIKGKNFELVGQAIKIFDLEGERRPDGWYISANHGNSSEQVHVFTKRSPIYILPEIMSLIEDDKTDGRLGDIDRIVMSSRVAIYLYLAGVLTPTDFAGATEEDMDISAFTGNDHQVSPAIHMDAVNFEDYMFPVSILSEGSMGTYSFASLNAEGDII